MAKKRLNIKDKTGLPVDYDISAENVTIDTIDGEGGKPLTQKLDEIAEAEAQAVRSITFNGQSYSRNNGIINIGEQEQPNWNESNPNYRTYIRNKPTLLSQFTNDCGFVTSSQIPEGADLSTVFASVAYDPTTSRINFFGKGSNTVLAYLDAAPFIVDGMVENVTLDSSTNELVITFNTASGKSPIRVPLGSISGQGTVQSVKMNGGTPIQPVNGVIDLGTVITEHQSLSSYATRSELNGKQDKLTGSDVLATINSTQVHYGESVNVVGQKGPKGDKGDTGDSTITDLNDVMTRIVNDLITGGGTFILSAEMGLVLRREITKVQTNLEALRNALANIAFTSLPKVQFTPLDWNLPPKTLTINGVTNTDITYNGSLVSGPITVPQGTEIQLLISPSEGYIITSLQASQGTLQENSDGTYTLSIVVNDDMTVTLTGSTSAAYNITYNLTDIKEALRPSRIQSGGTVDIPLSPAEGFALTQGMITVTGASYSYANNVLVLSSPTGNVAITAEAEASSAAYKGVRYEPKTDGAYLHVGQAETYAVSQLIDLGATRQSAVSLVFSTSGSTSTKLGLVLFDENKEYVGFRAQSASEKTESIPSSVRFVLIQTNASSISSTYLKRGNKYLFDGSEVSGNELDYAAFMALPLCPQPNDAGDYEGWSPCKADQDFDLATVMGNTSYDNFKTICSFVTALGELEQIPWVVGALTEFPNDGKITYCSAEKAPNDQYLPVILVYTINNGVIESQSFSVYTRDASEGGVRSATFTRSHFRNVVRLTHYLSDNTAVYVLATTNSALLWGNEYAHDTM